MAQARPIATPLASGKERRAFPRHAVQLKATCGSAGGSGHRPCEVRDFCEQGMLLAYEHASGDRSFLPAVGEIIRVVCVVPPDTEQQSLRFSGRVVRADGFSAGIVLIDPDRRAIARLIEYAQNQNVADFATTRDAATVTATIKGGSQDLINTCRERIQLKLDFLIDDVYTAVLPELTAAADRATSYTQQMQLLDTVTILKRGRDSVRAQFITSVPVHIEELLKTGNAAVAEGDSNSPVLTLLEEKALEDWLVVTDLSNHIETRLQSVLTDLEHRLEQILGRQARKHENPFGPQVFVQAFQDAVRPLALSPEATQLCYSAVRGVLVRHLETVYRELNELLIKHGVLPDLKPMLVRSGSGGKPDRRSASEPAVPAAETGGYRPEPGAAPAGSRPMEPQHVDPASASTPIPRGQIEQTLYDVVSELRDLRQYVMQTTGGRDAARSQPDYKPPQSAAGNVSPPFNYPQAPATAQSASLEYDRGQILGALNRLQSGPGAQPASTSRDYRSLVLSQLPDGGERSVGRREGAILETAGNLFELMMRDEMVAKSVRTWLSRLEIPLLKLAIQDDSWFTDRNHVARQIVNRISELEGYDGPDTDGDNAIMREVNTLVDRIAAEPDLNKDKLTGALKRLNALIRVQHGAYEENLRDVVRECEAAPEPDPALAADADEADVDQQEWSRRAKRLKVGTWVNFAIDPANPRHLRLAWISKQRDRYAFVNARGLKELVLDIGRLTGYLRSGSAMILEGADEPTLDRAQYLMLQELHHKLLHETTHDQLTALLNRREFERELQEALVAARQLDRCHTLCYFDITQFSVINTTAGYQAGDQLLIEAAGLLRKVMGQGALIARVGSDEFAVLLENCPSNYGRKICEDFLEALRGYRFNWQEEKHTVSFDIGVVQTDAFEDVSALLQAAEACCRAAAARGMNQIEVYHPDSTHVSTKHRAVQWLTRIDNALDEGKLGLRYQRIVPISAAAGMHRHSEILLALTDDAGSPISPQEFIITAEHYHRMPAIDRWVISTVFRFMSEHRDRLETVGGFAINLSGRSLSDGSFREFILSEVQKTSVPMDRVCFEVTETAGISNLSDASNFILEMKKTGCLFSLDDFGSGLSSYSYLKNLPVDFLKIDGGFVKHMDANPTDYAVVKSITEIGHFMGKQIVAECVETSEVLERLREIGVDYAQGYAIEAPRRLETLFQA